MLSFLYSFVVAYLWIMFFYYDISVQMMILKNTFTLTKYTFQTSS